MADETTPSFWATVWTKTKAILLWVAQKLLAPGVALLVVVGAVVLVVMGVKGIQIGGLLSRLLGRKDPQQALDVVNSVDPDRKVPVGMPDTQGITQVQVVPIDPTGLFSNPDTVTFTPPGEAAPVEVKLPDGVKNSDVEHVIVVKPDVLAVSVKDTSGVKAQTVDDLLKKYGG